MRFAQKLGELFARELGLLGRQGERVVHRQDGGEVAREVFRRRPTRGEDEDGAEVGQECLGDEARPVAVGAGVELVGQRVEHGLLQRHGAQGVDDQFHVAPQAAQPGGHVARIADAAAQEQELRARRREGEGEFVVRAPVGVAEHLVFVDDQDARAASAQQGGALGFQGGDDHPRAGVDGHVARADAHVPPGGAPLGVLVVRQCAGGHGVDGLSLERAVEQLEDVGLPEPVGA